MDISQFIANRIAFNKNKSFSKVIIRIAMWATAISVAVMILATGFVNGFQQVIKEKVFSFWGHIHINQYQPNAGPLTQEKPFTADTALMKHIQHLPEVKTISTYATKSAIIKSDKEIAGVMFKGVDKGYDWPSIKEYLVEGTIPAFNDTAYAQGILISAALAKELQLHLHDKVILYFIQGGGQSPRARRLTISGIYKTSIEEYDKTYIIGDINLVRRLNDWLSNEIGGYEISLKDYHQMDAVASNIDHNLLPDELFTRTIKEIYPNIFDWLQLQGQNEVIIIAIMTIVAIINMITAILILILERTNMVGTLKALGMRNWSIQKIFVFQAAYIVFLGVIIGNILGLGLAFIQVQTGVLRLPEDSYYMSTAAISLRWHEIVLINVGTFVVCTAVLLLPSLIIRRITPIKAIQFK